MDLTFWIMIKAYKERVKKRLEARHADCMDGNFSVESVFEVLDEECFAMEMKDK